MKPVFAHELAERALSNYRFLKKNEDQNNKDVFATTALLSSLLLTVVSPKEDIEKTFKDAGLPLIVNQLDWPNEIAPYKDRHSELVTFIVQMRNAVAHNDFEFLIDDKDVVIGASFNIKLENENIEVQFFENDLYKFAKCITEIYKSINIHATASRLA